MEELLSPELPISTSCRNCSAQLKSEEVFCGQCGYPENGTIEQRDKFQSRLDAKMRLYKIIKKEIKNAKTTLIVLGSLCMLGGLVFTFVSEDLAGGISFCIISIIYFGLAIWSDKQPFAALLTALILYITLILLNAVIDPITIFKGIIWKILIIGYLIKGVNSGNEAKKVMKELEDLGFKDA